MVRAVAMGIPLCAAIGFVATAAFVIGAPRREWTVVEWTGLLVASCVITLALEPCARRLTTLAILFEIDAVFPSKAPNRFRVLLRTRNMHALQSQLASTPRDDAREDLAIRRLLTASAMAALRVQRVRGRDDVRLAARVAVAACATLLVVLVSSTVPSKDGRELTAPSSPGPTEVPRSAPPATPPNASPTVPIPAAPSPPSVPEAVTSADQPAGDAPPAFASQFAPAPAPYPASAPIDAGATDVSNADATASTVPTASIAITASSATAVPSATATALPSATATALPSGGASVLEVSAPGGSPTAEADVADVSTAAPLTTVDARAASTSGEPVVSEPITDSSVLAPAGSALDPSEVPTAPSSDPAAPLRNPDPDAAAPHPRHSCQTDPAEGGAAPTW